MKKELDKSGKGWAITSNIINKETMRTNLMRKDICQ